MDLVLMGCEYPLRFPLNLAVASEIPLDLERYNALIYEQATALFSQRKFSQRFIYVHEYRKSMKSWTLSKLCTADELRRHLKLDEKHCRDDVLHRLYFLETHCPAAPFHTTHDLFALALSFHQITPTLLDSLLEYGPHHPQLLSAPLVFKNPFTSPRGLRSSRLARSGTIIESSYTIRCPQRCLPGVFGWDIGSATIYSSFDMYYGSSTWFIFSSDEDLRKAFVANTNDLESTEPADLLEFTNSFEKQLEFHLEILDWARERWKDYYNDAEICLQGLVDDCAGEQDWCYNGYGQLIVTSLADVAHHLEAIMIADSSIWKELLAKQRIAITTWRETPVNERKYRPASEYYDDFSTALDDFEVEMLYLLEQIQKSFARFKRNFAAYVTLSTLS